MQIPGILTRQERRGAGSSEITEFIELVDGLQLQIINAFLRGNSLNVDDGTTKLMQLTPIF
ncbi:hypothetical protein J6590_062780 [Homalodisca vitripennis]|nr:hypothetical protein J6590_062780 [Homalodisca vitripennis]